MIGVILIPLLYSLQTICHLLFWELKLPHETRLLHHKQELKGCCWSKVAKALKWLLQMVHQNHL